MVILRFPPKVPKLLPGKMGIFDDKFGTCKFFEPNILRWNLGISDARREGAKSVSTGISTARRCPSGVVKISWIFTGAVRTFPLNTSWTVSLGVPSTGTVYVANTSASLVPQLRVQVPDVLGTFSKEAFRALSNDA